MIARPRSAFVPAVWDLPGRTSGKIYVAPAFVDMVENLEAHPRMGSWDIGDLHGMVGRVIGILHLVASEYGPEEKSM
ncbi:hypothetical protein PG985_005811 [Apiospora marii]|uniref:uncharacterized protein n=1 Tax=Apiospora marii TaxID=335849 RepID=UPI00312F6C52